MDLCSLVSFIKKQVEVPEADEGLVAQLAGNHINASLLEGSIN